MSQDVGIKVNRASVHTLSLSVQVMKLDKRQVTLAVFRQLDSGELMIPQGILTGTPWGRVNYHVDCDPYGGRHLHMVWQKGDRLYRTTIYRKLHEQILRGNWDIANAEEHLFNDRWGAGYDKLAAMDQLFIAI